MVLSAYLLNNAQNHIAFATRRCKKQDKKWHLRLVNIKQMDLIVMV